MYIFRDSQSLLNSITQIFQFVIKAYNFAQMTKDMDQIIVKNSLRTQPQGENLLKVH